MEFLRKVGLKGGLKIFSEKKISKGDSCSGSKSMHYVIGIHLTIETIQIKWKYFIKSFVPPEIFE